MAQLTKQALIVENNQSFPNNNTGAITPTILRNFNTDMIDSTVNQESYTTASAIVDGRLDNLENFTGSALITGSVNGSTITFTKGDGTTFDLAVTASVGSVAWDNVTDKPSGLVSGSSQLTASYDTRYALSGSGGSTDLTSLNAFTSSQQTKNTTLATYTGSIDTKFSTLGSQSGSWITESETGSMSVNYAVTASKAQDLYVNCKNSSGAIIAKGSIVRITGATGDNPEIGLADWTNDGSSANTLGITTEAVAINAFTDVVVQGRVIGLSTQAFTAGQLIFLGPNGTIVASVPTPYHEVRLGQVLRSQANNGSIYLSIDNGYELSELHDVNIVTASLANNNLLAYDSASLQWTNKSISTLGIPQLSVDNTFTGTNSFQSISAVSASFQYVQSVTGSAVYIGDSFVVVNNDTPAQPYGGLSVYDSGSVTPTTSSLVWDGTTNDWKYSYDVGAGHDAAVMLFGPGANGLASTPYPTNNKIQKGTGGHHLADSSIYDDGTNVSIGGNVNVTGSISTNGNAVLTNSSLTSLNTFTASQESKNTTLGGQSGSWQQGYESTLALNTYTQSNDTKWNTLGAVTASQAVLNATYATTGSNTFNGNQTINGSNTLNVGGQILAQSGIYTLNGSGVTVAANTNNSGSAYSNVNVFVDTTTDPTNVYSAIGLTDDKGNGNFSISMNSYASQYPGVTVPTLIGFYQNQDGSDLAIAFPSNGHMDVWKKSNFKYGLSVTGSTQLQSFTSSLQQGYAFVGGANGRTTTVPTSSFAGGGTINTGSFATTGSNVFTAGQTILNGGIDLQSNVEGSGSAYLSVTGKVDTTSDPTNVYSALQLVKPGSGDNLIGLAVNSYSAQYGTATPMILADGNNPDGNNTAIGFTSNGNMDVWKKSNFKYGVSVTGSLSVSGSVNTSVHNLTITSNTASLNASIGNTFQLNLVSGSATRLEVSSAKSGQTINLLVSQSASGPGTLVFGDNIVEPSGSFYSASQVASAEDILTLATFVNTGKIYVANIKNLI